MIVYKNIQNYSGKDADYHQSEGFSYSFLKREEGGVSEDLEITDNIRIGSMVDAILTEPNRVNMGSHLYPACRDIAHEIKYKFGSILERADKQVAFVADMEFNGFVMRTRGKLDYLIRDNAIIDLKVTKSSSIRNVYEYMGYKNQLWHYAKLAQVDRAYCMVYSIPKKKTEFLFEDCISNENEFWQEKILKFGNAAG